MTEVMKNIGLIFLGIIVAVIPLVFWAFSGILFVLGASSGLINAVFLISCIIINSVVIVALYRSQNKTLLPFKISFFTTEIAWILIFLSSGNAQK